MGNSYTFQWQCAFIHLENPSLRYRYLLSVAVIGRCKHLKLSILLWAMQKQIFCLPSLCSLHHRGVTVLFWLYWAVLFFKGNNAEAICQIIIFLPVPLTLVWFNRPKRTVAHNPKGMQQLVVLVSTHLFILCILIFMLYMFLYNFYVTFGIHFMCPMSLSMLKVPVKVLVVGFQLCRASISSCV